MNPLQGITFYDSINRLVIGFLASLWIFFCPNIFRRELDPAIVTATYLIACYIFGLFFSLLVDRIATVKPPCCLGHIFYKNDIIRIRLAVAKQKVLLTHTKGQLAIDAYFERYYDVQQAGLLGKVPAMETISAFLMNLAALCILYMTGALLVILFTCNCCQYIWIPILSLFLVIFAKIARNYVESNIYKAILSASKFLEQTSKNTISSNRLTYTNIMRHFLRMICVFIFAFLAVFNASSATADVVIRDLVYRTDSSSKTAVLIGSNNRYLSSLIILESIIGYDGLIYPVVGIGQSAFRGSSGLTGSLKIPESIISIGDYAFSETGFTGPLTIPNSVREIGKGAFYDCYGFTGPLTIGSSVKTIGNGAFMNCWNLTGSLKIPESVTSIGDQAFSNLNLTGSLTIPNSVRRIGKYAFSGCTGFTGSLTIGNSVTEIDNNAFSSCSGIEWVKSLNPEAPAMYTDPFPSSDITIRVPAGSRIAYISRNGWKIYSNIYEFGDVNHSEKITVSDAVADANYIIGIEPAGTFDEICGDMNLDGRVSLLDVSQIIDAVSEYNPDDMDVIVKAESRVPAMTNGELKVLRSNNGISGITVACDYDVTAFQCDIHTDGIRPEDIILDNSLEATHSLTVSQINDDTVRAIIFSMESATIDKSERIIWLDINNTSEIEIKNIIAADPNALEYNLANVIAPGVTSNIDYVDLESCGLSFRDGCLNVSGAIGKQLNVYDISGKTVYSSTIVSDDYSVSLAPGLYIVAIDSYKTKLIVDK